MVKNPTDDLLSSDPHHAPFRPGGTLGLQLSGIVGGFSVFFEPRGTLGFQLSGAVFLLGPRAVLDLSKIVCPFRLFISGLEGLLGSSCRLSFVLVSVLFGTRRTPGLQ